MNTCVLGYFVIGVSHSMMGNVTSTDSEADVTTEPDDMV